MFLNCFLFLFFPYFIFSIVGVFLSFQLYLLVSSFLYDDNLRVILATGTGQGPIKVYYIQLDVANYGTDATTISWISGDVPSSRISYGGSETFITLAQTSSTQPPDVNFTAVNSNGSAVFLNNHEVLIVTPTEEKRVIRVVICKFPFL